MGPEGDISVTDSSQRVSGVLKWTASDMYGFGHPSPDGAGGDHVGTLSTDGSGCRGFRMGQQRVACTQVSEGRRGGGEGSCRAVGNAGTKCG